MYLIIFAGLMLAQALSFALMYYERDQSATTVMLDSVEHEVGTSVAVLDRLPAAERPNWLGRLQRDNFRFVLGDGRPGTPLASSRSRELMHRIEREVGPDYHVKGDTISMHPERYQVHFTLHDGATLTL
ncbi:MAG: two-component sensor histidine kinase, partial [Burkholderiales bacterium]|nr:two-component sensor histidine kinase [Burkholderiales bacterium]